jgi:2-methylcitrate dehydratase PrpD
MSAGPTERLVALARGIDAKALPPEVLAVARHCVLDCLGCAIAGTDEPAAAIARAALGGGDGPCTVIASPARVGPLDAALVNGVAAHALDYDDTHWALHGHASAPILPAVLALAEARGMAGRDLTAAFVAGVEVACQLGAWLNPAHYDAGFHATGTLGAFGAAAGCARLLGLEAEAFRHALGLAAAQAAGLKSSFGTMAKPLQAGRAAANGVLAALLAERGFTADPNALEAHQGFAATHLAGRAAPVPDTMEGPPARFAILDTLFKRHASCHLTHAAIECALALRAKHRIDPAAIERMDVVVAPGCLDVCNIAEPRTGLEAKFSLRMTTAMALLGDDTGDPAAFSDARAGAPDLTSLVARVAIGSRPGPLTRAQVRMRMVGGAAHEASHDTGAPERDLARQEARLEAKFTRLVTPVMGAPRTRELAACVIRLDALDSVREMTALLAGAESRSSSGAPRW